MEIHEEKELTSFEVPDKEPFHYMAFYRQENSSAWFTFSAFPTTDKASLLKCIYNLTGVEEVRIFKVRLPIG
jgi:hypothetical protein